MPLKKIVLLFICLFSLVSCVDKLDFNQINDFEIAPTFTSSLTYFTLLPSHFFNSDGSQVSSRTDVTGFKIFDDNLLKLKFYVEIRNEIDKNFTVQVEFLDSNNLIVHRFNQLEVDAKNLDFKFEEEVEVSTNSNIKYTNKVRIILNIINPNPPLDFSDRSKFEFKSSVNIYLNTDA